MVCLLNEQSAWTVGGRLCLNTKCSQAAGSVQGKAASWILRTAFGLLLKLLLKRNGIRGSLMDKGLDERGNTGRINRHSVRGESRLLAPWIS